MFVRRRLLLVLMLALGALIACGGRGRGGGVSLGDGGLPSADGGAAVRDSSVDPLPMQGAPRFLSFATSRPNLSPDESVVFTAVVTDPDGIDDLIGGELIDAASNFVYGAFQTASAEGSYQIDVPWDAIVALAPAHSGTRASVSRTFRARFFDVAGLEVVRSIDLALGCFRADSQTPILCRSICTWEWAEDDCFCVEPPSVDCGSPE